MEPDLFAHVGARIRELRTGFDGGKGMSQEALGKALRVTANTISRWETATYEPRLRDLERVSRFFGVPITRFLPGQTATANEKVDALLRTAKQLPDSDLEELRRFAEFRRAHAIYPKGRPRPGRKRQGREGHGPPTTGSSRLSRARSARSTGSTRRGFSSATCGEFIGPRASASNSGRRRGGRRGGRVSATSGART